MLLVLHFSVTWQSNNVICRFNECEVSTHSKSCRTLLVDKVYLFQIERVTITGTVICPCIVNW